MKVCPKGSASSLSLGKRSGEASEKRQKKNNTRAKRTGEIMEAVI